MFFTTALFLSGYAIQQRTLREIRASIKPPPRPSQLIFLPDRFKKMTTELSDGSIVVIDEEDEYPLPRVGPIIHVEQTPRVDEVAILGPEDAEPDVGDEIDIDMEIQAEDSDMSLESKDTAQIPQREGRPRKKISAAERRRRIKDELKRLAMGTNRGTYQRRLY